MKKLLFGIMLFSSALTCNSKVQAYYYELEDKVDDLERKNRDLEDELETKSEELENKINDLESKIDDLS